MALFYAFLIFILMIVLFIGLYHFFKLREYSKKLEKDLKSCKENFNRNNKYLNNFLKNIVEKTDNSDDCNLDIMEIYGKSNRQVNESNDL